MLEWRGVLKGQARQWRDWSRQGHESYARVAGRPEET